MSQSEWAEWQQQFRYGTFIIQPPDAVRSLLNPIRERYSPVASTYAETHITLTQPFLSPPTDNDIENLKSIVSTFEPITITYGPVQTWASGQIIYLAVQPADQLAAIREALHETKLFNLDLPYTDDFVPHITIQEGYSDGSTRDIIDPQNGMANYELLKTTLQGGTFLCDQITWIVPDAQFHFSVSQQLSLGNVTHY